MGQEGLRSSSYFHEKCLFCNVTEKSYFSVFFWGGVLPQFSGRKKQPFTDVLHNRCSQKFCNIHRETPVLESLFNQSQTFWPAALSGQIRSFFCSLFSRIRTRKNSVFGYFSHSVYYTFFTEYLSMTAYCL